MTEHGQTGQGGKHGCNAKIFIAIAELLDGSLFIGVVHEVDVALEDLRIELERVLDRQAILGVVFVAQHVHERRVVDAVHAQRADKISFHQPEGFGQQQRIGDFGRDAVHDLAPELLRDGRVELGPGHAMLGPGWDRATRAGFGEPQALDMLLGQRHRRVEADDREIARHVQDGLNDRFAHFGFGVIELRGVVPREGCAVVAVIDIADIARLMITALERPPPHRSDRSNDLRDRCRHADHPTDFRN